MIHLERSKAIDLQLFNTLTLRLSAVPDGVAFCSGSGDGDGLAVQGKVGAFVKLGDR